MFYIYEHAVHDQHEAIATWFSASDCLLSGDGIFECRSKRISIVFNTPLPARLSFLTAFRLLFLLYPLVGHLTDV